MCYFFYVLRYGSRVDSSCTSLFLGLDVLTVHEKYISDLSREAIAYLYKRRVPISRPPSRALSKYGHGQTQPRDQQSQHAENDEAILHAGIDPVARNEGECHGKRVVDDSDADHALKNHFTTAVSNCLDLIATVDLRKRVCEVR
jgi:hypothetical protein